MKRESVDHVCPLCRESIGDFFFEDSRKYLRCPLCYIVFVSPDKFLSPQEEKAVYDQHENSPSDVRYRGFLSRIFVPVSERIKPRSTGLDFGSGPGPTLSVMFTEAGHQMTIYDPFYAPDSIPFEQDYDFITASEVVEHLHFPQQEFDRLWSCLKPGGTLGIMTKRVIDRDAFASWHYKDDPTHVCFFSLETFQWLATNWDANLLVVGNDVVLLIKPCADYQSS